MSSIVYNGEIDILWKVSIKTKIDIFNKNCVIRDINYWYMKGIEIWSIKMNILHIEQMSNSVNGPII